LFSPRRITRVCRTWLTGLNMWTLKPQTSRLHKLSCRSDISSHRDGYITVSSVIDMVAVAPYTLSQRILFIKPWDPLLASSCEVRGTAGKSVPRSIGGIDENSLGRRWWLLAVCAQSPSCGNKSTSRGIGIKGGCLSPSAQAADKETVGSSFRVTMAVLLDNSLAGCVLHMIVVLLGCYSSAEISLKLTNI